MIKDWTGHKFNNLTFIRLSRPRHWELLCDCGNTVIIRSDSVISGHTKSCGCLKARKAKLRNGGDLLWCSACHKNKPISDFGRRTTKGRNGLDFVCKECKREQTAHRRIQKRKIQARYLNAKISYDPALPYITKLCVVCGQELISRSSSHKRCSECNKFFLKIASGMYRYHKISDTTLRPKEIDIIYVVKKWCNVEKCLYCKRKFTKDNPKSVDHIIPVSRGGSSNPDNINICCKQCNKSKYDLLLGEWIELCTLVAKEHRGSEEKPARRLTTKQPAIMV